jgi:hypothetical protein
MDLIAIDISPPDLAGFPRACAMLANFAELVRQCKRLAQKQLRAPRYEALLALMERLAAATLDGSLATLPVQAALAEEIRRNFSRCQGQSAARAARDPAVRSRQVAFGQWLAGLIADGSLFTEQGHCNVAARITETIQAWVEWMEERE